MREKAQKRRKKYLESLEVSTLVAQIRSLSLEEFQKFIRVYWNSIFVGESDDVRDR